MHDQIDVAIQMTFLLFTRKVTQNKYESFYMACKESYYLKLKDEKDVNILFSIFHSWHLNGNKGQKWTMVSLKNRNSIQSKEKENT